MTDKELKKLLTDCGWRLLFTYEDGDEEYTGPGESDTPNLQDIRKLIDAAKRESACENDAPGVESMVLGKAKYLLACRDALASGDADEAYHQLYWSVDWANPYEPWAEWEAAAGTKAE